MKWKGRSWNEEKLIQLKLGGGFKIFYFHFYLGKWSNLTNIFHMGWNHQLVNFRNGKWTSEQTLRLFRPFPRIDARSVETSHRQVIGLVVKGEIPELLEHIKRIPFPDTQCMVYLPTFTIKIYQMWVNMPYIEHLELGNIDTMDSIWRCSSFFRWITSNCQGGQVYWRGKINSNGLLRVDTL